MFNPSVRCHSPDGVAFGDDYNGLIGTSNFALRYSDGSQFSAEEYASFFFQWAFASTAATILSGAVADRIRLVAYIVFSCFLAAFICTSAPFLDCVLASVLR